MADIESGIGPDTEFEASDMFRRDNKSPIKMGISPVNALEERFKNSRFSRLVMEECILPLSLLCDKSMWVMFKCQCLGR